MNSITVAVHAVQFAAPFADGAAHWHAAPAAKPRRAATHGSPIRGFA